MFYVYRIRSADGTVGVGEIPGNGPLLDAAIQAYVLVDNGCCEKQRETNPTPFSKKRRTKQKHGLDVTPVGKACVYMVFFFEGVRGNSL